MRRLTFFVLSTLFLLVLSGNVLAEDVGQQMKTLRQEMQALRTGSIQSNNNAAQAIAQLQDLTTQFEALKASIDSNAHSVSQLGETVNLRLQDMEARIAGLEERLSIQGKQVTAAVSTVAPEAATEAALYQSALNQVNSSEFLKSIATFKKFMAKFPKSDYISNAQYWVAECYFALGDYEQAIKEFQVVVEKYPRSDKAPAALLKQGFSFVQLNMESDAIVFLNNVIKRYPRTKEAKAAEDRIKRLQELKSTAKKPAPAGDVPLAPGVTVPEKSNKGSGSKY